MMRRPKWLKHSKELIGTKRKSIRITHEGLLDRMYAPCPKGTYRGPYERETMAVLLRPLFKRGKWGSRDQISWGYFFWLREKEASKGKRKLKLTVGERVQTVVLDRYLIESILQALVDTKHLTPKQSEKVYSVHQTRDDKPDSFKIEPCLPTLNGMRLYFTEEVTAQAYGKALRRFPVFNHQRKTFVAKVRFLCH